MATRQLKKGDKIFKVFYGGWGSNVTIDKPGSFWEVVKVNKKTVQIGFVHPDGTKNRPQPGLFSIDVCINTAWNNFELRPWGNNHMVMRGEHFLLVCEESQEEIDKIKKQAAISDARKALRELGPTLTARSADLPPGLIMALLDSDEVQAIIQHIEKEKQGIEETGYWPDTSS